MEEQTKRVVYVGDPALDARAMKIRGPGGYGETRDESLVRTLPGRTPIWFTVRWLTPRESIIVEERGTPLRKTRAAISTALVAVDLPNATTMRPATSVPAVEGNGERMLWDDEALDDLWRRFGKLCMYDIGTVILEKDDQPGEAFASGEGARFTLLPSSLAALEQNERRLAALTPPGSGTRS